MFDYISKYPDHLQCFEQYSHSSNRKLINSSVKDAYYELILNVLKKGIKSGLGCNKTVKYFVK